MIPDTQPEMVTHPAHYGGDTTYEVIKVLEAWTVGSNIGGAAAFCLNNTIKYIARCESKGHCLEDLKKAKFYLDRVVNNLEKEQSYDR